MNNVKELLSPHTALKHYGINWGIGSKPVQWNAPPPSNRFDFNTMSAPPATIEDLPHRVMYRKDTGKPLGIVSDKYTPFNNQQFADSISSILHEDNKRINAGGSYRGGKAVWLSADLDTVKIAGCDPVAQSCVFYTSHDGGGSFRMVPTNERVFCSNQFTALDKSNAISIRHTGDTFTIGIERARAALAGILNWHETFEETANLLAGQSVNAEWLAEYFRRSYVQGMPSATRTLLSTPVTTDMPLEDVAKRERAEARLEAHIETMAGNYQKGFNPNNGGIFNKCNDGIAEIEARRQTEGLPSTHMPDDIRGSKWHAFNAYSHYIDHDSNRGAESIHVGAAAQLKQTALELAGSL